MDREGGLQAMSALNGTRLEGSPKPLSVQLYVSHHGNIKYNLHSLLPSFPSLLPLSLFFPFLQRTTPTSSTPIIQRSDIITSDKTLRVSSSFSLTNLTSSLTLSLSPPSLLTSSFPSSSLPPSPPPSLYCTAVCQVPLFGHDHSTHSRPLLHIWQSL